MEVDFSVSGLDELNALLKKLPDELARKAGESAVRAGGNLLKKAAQAKAPVEEGDLKDSIVVRKRRNAGTGVVGYALRVLSPHGHLVEWGAAAHKIVAGKSGKKETGKKVLASFGDIWGKEVNHPGAKAQPFIRPTIDENQTAYLNKLREVLAMAITRNAFKFTGRKK